MSDSSNNGNGSSRLVRLDEDTHGKPDAYDRWQQRRQRKQDRAERKRQREESGQISPWLRIYSAVRPVIIIAACVLIVYFLLSTVVNKLVKDYLMPVDPNDATPVVVEIPPGSGASAIAKILYEACGEGQEGLIPHKAVFKIYVDFIGKANRLQAGTYVLSKNMSVEEIVDVICKGNPPKETITVKLAEGLTLEAMADKLVEQGFIDDPDEFLSLLVTGESFISEHLFISEIPEDPTGERSYALEGFLFPASYELYADAGVETLIDKMLTKFEQVFGPIYTARARELNMSFYEVVTLASILEKEAKPFDFAKVSAVFHNRLEREMPFDSDATLEYVLRTGTLNLTDEQLNTPSGYNTHLNMGLPLGPVSNPGDGAINAALYPDEQFIEDGYLYFCLMDPQTGALIFAKTLAEHNRNVATYSPLWP